MPTPPRLAHLDSNNASEDGDARVNRDDGVARPHDSSALSSKDRLVQKLRAHRAADPTFESVPQTTAEEDAILEEAYLDLHEMNRRNRITLETDVKLQRLQPRSGQPPRASGLSSLGPEYDQRRELQTARIEQERRTRLGAEDFVVAEREEQRTRYRANTRQLRLVGCRYVSSPPSPPQSVGVREMTREEYVQFSIDYRDRVGPPAIDSNRTGST